jgi:hypothetical protein
LQTIVEVVAFGQAGVDPSVMGLAQFQQLEML